MRGSQFEGLPRTEAIIKQREYERHKLKLKTVKTHYTAEEAIQTVDGLINSFQSKKSQRTTFDKQTSDD